MYSFTRGGEEEEDALVARSSFSKSTMTRPNKHRDRVSKMRAGVFVIDRNLNTCLVLQPDPYPRSSTHKTPFRKYVDVTTNDIKVHTTIRSHNEHTESADFCDSYTESFPKNVVQFTADPSNKVCPRYFEYNYFQNSHDNQTLVNKIKLASLIEDTHIEKIQIPRGISEAGESLLITALREFGEETRCVNSDFIIYTKPFELTWTDDGTRWTYMIYVAYTPDPLRIWYIDDGGGVAGGDEDDEDGDKNDESNTITRINFHRTKDDFYPFDEKGKLSCDIIPLLPETHENAGRYVAFMSCWVYFEYLTDMIEKRRLYRKTNYLEFIGLCMKLIPYFENYQPIPGVFYRIELQRSTV